MKLARLKLTIVLAERELAHDVERIQIEPLARIDDTAAKLPQPVHELVVIEVDLDFILAERLVAERRGPDSATAVVEGFVAGRVHAVVWMGCVIPEEKRSM